MPLADISTLHALSEPDREEAALCIRCGLPGLRIISINLMPGKWRTVYECPVCRVAWFTFKREKQLYNAEDFT